MKHQEVIDWLKYCDENNIKPWEWDFKTTHFLHYPMIVLLLF